jgi:hypothetical protein
VARFSIEEVAPREETRKRVFKLLGHRSEVTYYPNRITLEPSGETTVLYDDDDIDDDDEQSDDEREANLAARNLCRLVHSWDWVGPVKRGDGSIVIDHDQPVPVDPEIVQCVPTRIIRALNDAISEDAFPKSRSERRSQRR